MDNQVVSDKFRLQSANKAKILILRLSLVVSLACATLLSSVFIVAPSKCNPVVSTINKQQDPLAVSVGVESKIQRQVHRHRRQQGVNHQQTTTPAANNNSSLSNKSLDMKSSNRIELMGNKLKRQLPGLAPISSTQRSIPLKRFKTTSSFARLGSAHDGHQSNHGNSTGRQGDNDINNNNNIDLGVQYAGASNDMNNNTIGNSTQSWTRNVNSVNGSIDLSQYEQSDVDRLYSDALLVYLKNFNETLPTRRETISVNGTTSRVPIYRSETKETKLESWTRQL